MYNEISTLVSLSISVNNLRYHPSFNQNKLGTYILNKINKLHDTLLKSMIHKTSTRIGSNAHHRNFPMKHLMYPFTWRLVLFVFETSHISDHLCGNWVFVCWFFFFFDSQHCVQVSRILQEFKQR